MPEYWDGPVSTFIDKPIYNNQLASLAQQGVKSYIGCQWDGTIKTSLITGLENLQNFQCIIIPYIGHICPQCKIPWQSSWKVWEFVLSVYRTLLGKTIRVLDKVLTGSEKNPILYNGIIKKIMYVSAYISKMYMVLFCGRWYIVTHCGLTS